MSTPFQNSQRDVNDVATDPKTGGGLDKPGRDDNDTATDPKTGGGLDKPGR